MALHFNGVDIPKTGSVVFNGQALKEYRHNGVLVWTATPDPITIMQTGQSLARGLAGACWAAMPGIRCFPWQTRVIKTAPMAISKPTAALWIASCALAAKKALWAATGLCWCPTLPLIHAGSNICGSSIIPKTTMCLPMHLRLGLGPAGWNETVNTAITLIKQNGTSAVQTVTLDLSNYQGLYAIKGKGFFLETQYNPYWAGAQMLGNGDLHVRLTRR